jgi:UDP-N-acetylmuramate--L-alanine ligase/UDP-N-acetylenolpyruvoylglucosamine reductase
MAIEKGSFFLLGIKGAAMANVAVMLTQLGKKVTGVDVPEEFITDIALANAGITYSTDFTDTTLVDSCEVFLYSAAHGGKNNPLAQHAAETGKTLITQSVLLGELLAGFQKSIAVSGCHGKTTTSSLLAWALSELGADPSFLIGAPPYAGGGGGRWTKSEYMVIEADEYGVQPPIDKTPKLLSLHPSFSICTNIDYDHPDVYDSIEDTKKTFLKFFAQSKRILAYGDDHNVQSILPDIAPEKYVLYGQSEQCDYRFTIQKTTAHGTVFSLSHKGKLVGEFVTELFGEKNTANAAAVVACLLEHGFAPSDIAKSLRGFSGAKRRQELVWTDGTSYLLDDYGHHPAEMKATFSGLSARFPGKRLHVIFQPHTFSRTQHLLTEFADVLSIPYRSYILPIFASARENQSAFSITSHDIAKKANLTHPSQVMAYDSMSELLTHFAADFSPGDIVLTLGAGDVYKYKNDIIEALNHTITPQTNVDLFPHLSMRIHTKAEQFFVAKSEGELVAAVRYANEKKIPFIMLGGGSNMVFREAIVPGLVIKNMYSAIEVIAQGDGWSDVRIGSGTPMSIAVQKTVEMGLSGLEYHRGLPGTVGGGVTMNSKWTKPVSYVGDSLMSARLMDGKGNIKEVDREYFKFAYDYSILQDTKEIVLSAVFRMKKSDPKELEARSAEAHAYRLKTQPMGIATCGCFFQNLTDEEQKKINAPTKSAGYLIDQCGLKGYTVGGFSISRVHANFIENDHNATARPEDLRQLVTTVKTQVKEKFGIDLKEEVKVL